MSNPPLIPPGVDILAMPRLAPNVYALLAQHFCVHRPPHETESATFNELAPRIRAIVGAGESLIDAPLITQLPALEMITIVGVGYDRVDVPAAKARGIMVTHTPGVLTDDVADLAIGLMICTARQLPQADRYIRDGKWLSAPMPLARKVSGARLGLVGMGRIGKVIAHRAAAFNISIAYTARTAKADVPYPFLPTPGALAAQSDFLVVITPGGTATRHLINAEVLAALGPKGILINVSRGSVVDEAALIDALERGTIAGAGLDVFEDEPRVPDRLKNLPHVVLTPHIGSATTATRQAMTDLAFENLQLHFTGHPVKTPVPECR